GNVEFLEQRDPLGCGPFRQRRFQKSEQLVAMLTSQGIAIVAKVKNGGDDRAKRRSEVLPEAVFCSHTQGYLTAGGCHKQIVGRIGIVRNETVALQTMAHGDSV